MEPTAYFNKVGSGPNLIFLHGWEQNKEAWGRIVDILSKDFTCWTVDLPYFGQNNIALADKTPLGYAKWLKAFLLKNRITKAYLLGHSFGGRIAIICAGNNKSIKKIVVYGTPVYRSNKGILSSVVKRLGIKNVPMISDRLRSPDYKSVAGVKKEIFIKAVNFDLLPFIKRVNKKTLLIWGEKDKEAGMDVAQKLKKAIANSELYIIPNAGHFAHLEKPTLFAATVRNFLKNG